MTPVGERNFKLSYYRGNVSLPIFFIRMYTLRSMDKLSRRTMLKGALSGAAVASVSSLSWSEKTAPIKRKGRIKQSVSRWCYKDIPLDQLCAYAAQIG